MGTTASQVTTLWRYRNVCIIIRSTPPSRPNKVGLKCPSARPFVRPSTKSFFDAVRYIKLAITSAFERTLIYRIVS